MRRKFARKPLSFQKIGMTEKGTLLSGAVAFTLSIEPLIPEFVPIEFDFKIIYNLGRNALKL